MIVDRLAEDLVFLFPLDERTIHAGRPLLYRPWGTRTIKLRVTTTRDLPRLRVLPRAVLPEDRALGVYKAYADDNHSLHITWGGGHESSPCVKSRDMLSAFETAAPLEAGDSGYLFFNLTHTGESLPDAATIFFESAGLSSALQRAFSFDTVVWWNWALPGLLSMSLFFFLVLGVGWGEVVLRDEVDAPNQGIIDSGWIGVVVAIGGVIAGLIFSLGIGLPCFLGMGFKASSGLCVRGDLNSLLSGLPLGVGLGAILGLIFGQIFGGFAWLRHYVVRFSLYLDRHQIPWRFEDFLAYATKLRLLRQVGGGFEFIDQELQAYFERPRA